MVAICWDPAIQDIEMLGFAISCRVKFTPIPPHQTDKSSGISYLREGQIGESHVLLKKRLVAAAEHHDSSISLFKRAILINSTY